MTRGLIIDVFDNTDNKNELASIGIEESDFEESNSARLEEAINSLLPDEDVSEAFCQQAFEDELTINQALYSYCIDHEFDLTTLTGIKGECDEFHAEVKKLVRPYFKLSESKYKNLMRQKFDYYMDRSSNVFTFGNADGGYALMPLNSEAAATVLANQ